MEGSALRKSYHAIIYKIFVSAPQMLFAVIPNIMHELLVKLILIFFGPTLRLIYYTSFWWLLVLAVLGDFTYACVLM